jgi:16S rRNA (cytosine1402-N4)-methyltransferase
MPKEPHEPVLAAELVELLALREGARIADLTVGAGGHAAAILAKAGTTARLLGLDRDGRALALAGARLGGDARARLVKARFAELAAAAAEALSEPAPAFDAVVLDLGVSSMQLDDARSGFSFQKEGPLDLRMGPEEGGLTAADVVNTASERELADLIYRFGEERASRRIARRIVEERARVKITSTTRLAEIVRACVPYSKADARRIDPATRTFQALRIAVNGELEELEAGLDAALAALAPRGRLAVISYHSLEDRIVKHRFRAAAEAGEYTILTKKPVRPGDEETRVNPRSRSAKLRVIERSAPAGRRAVKGRA